MNTIPKSVTVVGVPYDRKASFLQGAALAPNRIRSVLHNGAANNYSELGVNPIDDPNFKDIGDLKIKHYFDIETKIKEILVTNTRILSLGGDHSITFPLIKAHQAVFGDFHILHIDAHTDLYDSYENDPYSHACPFARIMENKLTSRLVQVGIRALTPHQREQAKRFGVEMIEMKDFETKKNVKFEKPIYLSLDLDGLDPAFAPGVSHHEPGGLTTRQVLDLIHGIDVPIIGADIVEYNPHRDVSDMTAALAAKLIKEIGGKMLV